MAAGTNVKSVTKAVLLPVTLEWTIRDFSKLCQLDQPPLKSSVYYEGMDLQLEVKYISQDLLRIAFCLVSCKYPLPL